MKKIFTLLSLALVGLAVQAQTTYVIHVDDPSHIASFTKDSEKLTFDADNNITINVPADSYHVCKIVTTDPWVLSTDSYYDNGEKNPIDTYFRNNNEFYINSYNNDTRYEFVTVDNNEIRKNVATINIIGDASKVCISDEYTYLERAIFVDGANTYRFMDAEKEVYIGAVDYSYNLYKVLHNDVAVVNDGRFKMTLADGDVVDVYTEWPDEDVTLTFEFQGDANSLKSISSAFINGEDITDFTQPVVAKMGKNFYIYLANINYTPELFTVNGVAQSIEYGGSYSCILTEDLHFVIKQTKKECYTANVTVNDYTLLKYREANVELRPTSNTFTIEVAKESAKFAPLFFYPIDYTAQIDECLVDGISAEYSYGDRDYYFNLTNDTKEVVINASHIERDGMFAFYFNSPKKASYEMADTYYLNGWWFNCEFPRQDLNDYNIKAGYNYFDFGVVDGQFQFGLYGDEAAIDKNAYLYYNNMKQASPYYSAPFLFTPQDGDVFKVYITEGVEPSWYNATFAVEDAAAVKDAYIDGITKVIVEDKAEYFWLQETGITLLLADGYVVKLDGKQIPPMEEPVLARSEGTVYYFDLVKDLKVEIVKGDAGITTIAADDNAADPAVYNILGVKVSNGSTDNLPAGLYIQKGQKFYVK